MYTQFVIIDPAYENMLEKAVNRPTELFLKCREKAAIKAIYLIYSITLVISCNSNNQGLFLRKK